MPSLGPAEILVILVIALLVFGPNKMPEIARQVGRGMREFRRVQQHLTSELRDVVSEFDGSSESAAAEDTPPPGDPVPTLPPKVETAPPDASIEPVEPVEPVAPASPDAPSTVDETPTAAETEAIPRGQRVWSPTPPADA
jgi:sec-independent protein translocase protein TatA